MTPRQERRVIEAAEAGLTINQITRGTPSRPAICSFNTLKFRRIANPELDRLIIANARNPLARSQLMRFRIVPANAQFFNLAETRAEIPPFEMQPGDYDWILSLISYAYDYQMRMDIAQDVLEALVRRAIGREQVSGRIVDFISRHRRTVGNPLHDEGLDATLKPGGKKTWVDVISLEQWKAGRD
ncbi:hypothetical protein CVM73_03465 [Bradyrhizobium forestalis]|uniref:Uncharacterized protein n=2 Tax=Bradyrhizobium forestalis TaxID=1419263 RepID=A0A2M8RFM1_9BRAD|nr:hypothetical protein CVM73_03465 [Bradyrhizobium forestalis]